MKCFFTPQKFCVAYLNLTGYQMKAYNIDFIYILINENYIYIFWQIKGIYY